MSNTTQAASSGIGFFGLLALIFITLKLTGFITWSWFWVLLPIMPALVIFGLIIIVLICYLLLTFGIAVVEGIKNWNKK